MSDYTLHLGDCLEYMRTLPDGCVDAVITDPPYGINYQSAWRTDADERFPLIAGDVALDLSWIGEIARVARTEAPIFIFCRWDVQEDFRQAIVEHFALRSQVIWDRGIHGLGDLKAQYAPCHDVAWFATKGKFEFPNGRPRSVYRVDRLSGGELVHPTQKPTSLMQIIINDLTKPGDTVFDPFMGSGTTGVACMKAGRKFVGCEIDPGYFAIAQRRIEDAAAQLHLFPEHDEHT